MKKRYSKKTPWLKTRYAKPYISMFAEAMANIRGPADMLTPPVLYANAGADLERALNAISKRAGFASKSLRVFAEACGRLNINQPTI